MKRVMLKTRARRGETFSEVLVAMLVVALASLLLVGMYSASMGIDAGAKDKDKDFYEAASKVEKFPTSTEVPANPTDPVKEETLTVKEEGAAAETTIPVYVYTTEDGMKAYRGK